MIEDINLSLIAIVVAAVAGMVIGALWYSPLLFGNAWLKAIGKTEDELASATPARICWSSSAADWGGGTTRPPCAPTSRAW